MRLTGISKARTLCTHAQQRNSYVCGIFDMVLRVGRIFINDRPPVSLLLRVANISRRLFVLTYQTGLDTQWPKNSIVVYIWGINISQTQTTWATVS